jgi:hypothetical protein
MPNNKPNLGSSVADGVDWFLTLSATTTAMAGRRSTLEQLVHAICGRTNFAFLTNWGRFKK